MSKIKKNRLGLGLLFVSPAIIGYIVFSAGPMLASLILSFTDYSVVRSAKFIGLDNYIRLFSGEDPFFYNSMKTTLYFVALNVPLGIIASLGVALLLNNKVKGWSIFRVVFYIPTIVPFVATAMIWMWLLNPEFGLVNSVLRALHLPAGNWMFGEATVIPSFAMMAIWSAGNIMVVFLAGLQGIPGELYESIEVDGGHTLVKLFHVTLPLMTPIIFFNIVMHMIASMQAFLQAYIITQGGPNNSSMLFVYYLYRESFEFQNIGGASAIAWVLFAGIALFTMAAFYTSKWWVFYGGDDK